MGNIVQGASQATKKGPKSLVQQKHKVVQGDNHATTGGRSRRGKAGDCADCAPTGGGKEKYLWEQAKRLQQSASVARLGCDAEMKLCIARPFAKLLARPGPGECPQTAPGIPG